jgi:hypothetical protein
MESKRALSLQVSDQIRHAVLGRNAPAQVDVVRQRMPFQQVDSTLTAQLPKD